MKKLLFILLLWPNLTMAGGPKNTYPIPRGMDDEMNNIYHDLKYPVISSATIQNETVQLSSIATAGITTLTVNTLNGNAVSTITNWASYTPTIAGFGTVSFVNFRWKQIGDTVYVMGLFQAGTVAGTAATISLPNSFSPLYGANGHNSTQDLVGLWQSSKTELTFANSDAGGLILSSPDTTVAFSRTGNAGGVWANTTGTNIVGNNGFVQVNFFFIHS